MIHLKTTQEIKIMKEGGKRLAKVGRKLLKLCEEDRTTLEIDQEAEKLIRGYGGEPSFKTVKGYFWTICSPINEQIVHTPPSGRKLKEGDLLTIDIGMRYKGFHTDYAYSLVIGESHDKGKNLFLDVGKKALSKGIKAVNKGRRVGDISQAIQSEIYGNNFFVIKALTGHGIGRKLHEDPFVPNFLDGPRERTPLLQPGMVIAVEVIYSFGTEQMVYEKGNSWSIVTADRNLSACFEHTVAVTDTGAIILTKEE